MINTKQDLIIGSKFGSWTVKQFGSKRPNGHHYLCKCDCGLVKEVRKADLLSGGSKSCYSCSMKKVRIPMVGRQFDHWTVISENALTKNDDLFYKCQCKCGKISFIHGGVLRTSRSNGCIKCTRFRKHGLSKDQSGKTPKIYRVWHAMIARCQNKKHKKYHLYGGRGIKVCVRWLKFENFLEDMGLHPIPNMQLDRIDVNGNYEPTNCRWVTPKENNANRRTSLVNRELYDLIPLDKACHFCKCPRHKIE